MAFDGTKIIMGAISIIIGLILLPLVANFIEDAQGETAVSNITGLTSVLDLVAYGFTFGLVGLGVKNQRLQHENVVENRAKSVKILERGQYRVKQILNKICQCRAYKMKPKWEYNSCTSVRHPYRMMIYAELYGNMQSYGIKSP